MERRLARHHEPVVLVWIFRLALAQGNWWHTGWWQVKFSLVVGLTLVHHLYSRWRKNLGRQEHAVCPLLSLVERGADGAHDRHRVPRGVEAVLDVDWRAGPADHPWLNGRIQ
jgi:hypothetical protein